MLAGLMDGELVLGMVKLGHPLRQRILAKPQETTRCSAILGKAIRVHETTQQQLNFGSASKAQEGPEQQLRDASRDAGDGHR